MVLGDFHRLVEPCLRFQQRGVAPFLGPPPKLGLFYVFGRDDILRDHVFRAAFRGSKENLEDWHIAFILYSPLPDVPEGKLGVWGEGFVSWQ